MGNMLRMIGTISESEPATFTPDLQPQQQPSILR